MIAQHGIKPENIVNLDQVPRYFEVENNATITLRGTREVFTKKASTSPKRFTFTPVITAGGTFLAVHLLFANLKNRPAVDPRCVVDVNKTGMCNDAVLKRIVEDFIIKNCQTVFNEPTLILLDSYDTHVKFVGTNAQRYARKNVYFMLIPPCMTGLLQPLDVAINRSFQQYYGDKYSEYISDTLKHLSNRSTQSLPKTFTL